MIVCKRIYGTAFIFLAIVFTSCRGNIACTEASAILNFVAFSDVATDSIILKKFIKDSGFTSLVDSVVITKNNSVYEKLNDTLHITTKNPPQGDYVINVNYDYEVCMPLVNKLYKITDIVQKEIEINEGISMDKRGCVNPIKSYMVNGELINSSLPNYAIIYIND